MRLIAVPHLRNLLTATVQRDDAIKHVVHNFLTFRDTHGIVIVILAVWIFVLPYIKYTLSSVAMARHAFPAQVVDIIRHAFEAVWNEMSVSLIHNQWPI